MATISAEVLRRDITGILKGADLAALSAKKIRRQLEDKYDADLTDRKEEIDKLVMAAITASQEQEESSAEESSAEEPAAQNDDSEQDSSDFDEPENYEPKPKKTKKNKDEELAKRLQEEEDNGSRRTRGGKGPSKKSANAKVKRKSEGSGAPKRNGYMQECILSPALSEVMGTDKMVRSDVVKKMWEIIRARNLQDPKQKQFMICDDQLQKIFGRKRVKTFGMMKYLKEHIFKPEDV